VKIIMGKYLDGFVLVVPKDKVEEYKEMARMGVESWMRHGALEYIESMGDDLEPKDMGGGMPRGFVDMTGAKDDETVWFSYVVYKSKQHRDEVNEKVMKEMSEMGDAEDFKMPFDMKRMAVGGFEVVVDSEDK
jgi:uncharacterized protein YbaA (DUF1428 family)